MQRDATYSSFASIDIRAELLVAAKLFSETFCQELEAHGAEKLGMTMADKGPGVFIRAREHRDQSEQPWARLSLQLKQPGESVLELADDGKTEYRIIVDDEADVIDRLPDQLRETVLQAIQDADKELF